jgi:hypothetical protein
VLGAEHPDTLTTRRELAHWTRACQHVEQRPPSHLTSRIRGAIAGRAGRVPSKAQRGADEQQTGDGAHHAVMALASAERAVAAALGASLLTGVFSVGAIMLQNRLAGRSADSDALAGAVTEMLSRSMAVSMRAQAVGEMMRIRSGLGEASMSACACASRRTCSS